MSMERQKKRRAPKRQSDRPIPDGAAARHHRGMFSMLGGAEEKEVTSHDPYEPIL